MPTALPKHLHKYFWGDDLSELNWASHQQYIAQTILEKGDRQAARWLLQNIDRTQLLEQIKQMKLSPKSANFWQVYLS
jgi:histidinol-phosphate/aromatic aminotransferase/cobyric acid decarboxylase-like protein